MELKQKLDAEVEVRRSEAMKLTREKPPAKLRMQELRDMNQVELTQDDRDKRLKDANAAIKVNLRAREILPVVFCNLCP